MIGALTFAMSLIAFLIASNSSDVGAMVNKIVELRNQADAAIYAIEAYLKAHNLFAVFITAFLGVGGSSICKHFEAKKCR